MKLAAPPLLRNLIARVLNKLEAFEFSDVGMVNPRRIFHSPCGAAKTKMNQNLTMPADTAQNPISIPA